MIRLDYFFAVTFTAVSGTTLAVDFARDVQPILAEHCLACHGADTAESNLRLDLKEYAFRAADSGNHAIVPGNTATSELLLRIETRDEDLRMPPEGEPLSDREIAILKGWIASGAEWSDHWAYRPIEPGSLPVVENVAWCRSPMDRFVLAKLEASDVIPSQPASREKLARRLHYDLLGLPPSVEVINEFVSDTSPDAYERLVDRILASPRFGERWGRHWLDKARYADSDGYEKDRNRPNAWRYRDWVIDAINGDMPFDQFTIEQLAGDLLPDATDDQVLATAFHRQTLTNTEGGTDQEQWRVAAVMDRTETLGTVWLGLTIGCARCHNHKYDQISQAEYYQLFAFFNNADESNHGLEPTSDQLEKFQDELRKHQATLADKQQQLAELQAEVPVASGDASDDANDVVTDDACSANERQQELDALAKEIEKLTKSTPKRPTFQVRIIRDRKKDLRTTHILRRGEFKEPLDGVTSGTLATLPPIESSATPERLRLARWLVRGDNPLVPRVAVNHIWQNLFGAGLIATPNDFGVRGEQPSHPRLLDYLAGRYVQLGWSRKAIIRSIVLSATYRQSSRHRPELAEIDAHNRLLYRQNRFRMEAENLRDITLSVANLLSNRIGGPSVFPPMPAEAAAVSYANNFKWKTSEGEDRYRRGIYTFFKRTAPHPTLTTFDCPDANVTNVKRNRSNTPIGALVLLNNEVYSEAASAFASTILDRSESDRSDRSDRDEDDIDKGRITFAFQRCVSRQPTTDEVTMMKRLLNTCREYYQTDDAAAKYAVGARRNAEMDLAEQAAWAATLRVVLNLDEFITRD